jgi:hypothetical protein
LNAPRVVAGVGQGVAAAVAECGARRRHRARLDADRRDRPAVKINAYFIELKNFDAIDARSSSSTRSILFSLQWLHNGTPPDFEMVQIQDEPVGWVNTANLTLLGELRRPRRLSGRACRTSCRCSMRSRRRGQAREPATIKGRAGGR